MSRSSIALTTMIAVGLSLIVAGCWLAWSLAAGLIAAGVAVILLAALILVEV